MEPLTSRSTSNHATAEQDGIVKHTVTLFALQSADNL
jgi:hypothetical protein